MTATGQLPSGGGGSLTTIATSSAIGATTVTLASIPADLVTGSRVALSAGTQNCEVRRVTGISTKTLTLNTALKVAHTAGDNARTVGFWVEAELWGAQANADDSSSTDSYRSIINALLDQAASTNSFGLRGYSGTGAKYYCSRPVFVGDFGNVDIWLKAYYPFAIDPTTTLDAASIPNQYFCTLAGQVVTATFNSSTDQATFSSSVGGTGSDVAFYPRPGSTMPAGIEEGRRYFTLTSGLTTTISGTAGGSAIDITSAGSGEVVAVSSGLARMFGQLGLNGNHVKALNGMFALVQQPEALGYLRIEKFPVVGFTVSADQGVFPNVSIFDCWMGLELAGALMTTWPNLDAEGCDTNISFAESTRFPLGAGTNDSVTIVGMHNEGTGSGVSQILTLVPTTNLTAGATTFKFKGVDTASVAYNASAATLQSALQAHPAIGSGNVTCTQLTGTNMSDGMIQCDFTVGALKWEQWVGSTDPRFGGQLAIGATNTLTGGPLTFNYVNPNGRNISFKNGKSAVIKGAHYSSVSKRADGTRAPFIQCEGTAIGVNGYQHGFTLEQINGPSGTTTGTVAVYDPLDPDAAVTFDDTTGNAAILEYYYREHRHGGSVHQPWWFAGDAGRKIRLGGAGKALLELKAGTAQTDDLFQAQTLAGAANFSVSKDGLIGPRSSAPPSTGTHLGGEIVWNSGVSGVGDPIGWVCTAGGTPGSWSAFGPAVAPTSPLYVMIQRTTDSSPITASTTLTNDDTLAFSIGANEACFVEGYLRILADNATMDFKHGWAVPAGCAVEFGVTGQQTAAIAGFGGVSSASTSTPLFTTGGLNTATNTPGTTGLGISAFFFNGSTPGTVTLKWAQNTSDAGNLVMGRYSFLRKQPLT